MSYVRWEAAMWRSETGSDGDRSWLDGEAFRARDFTEFGRSGRRYARAEILDLDVGESTRYCRCAIFSVVGYIGISCS